VVCLYKLSAVKNIISCSGEFMHFIAKLILSGFLVFMSFVSAADQLPQSFKGMYLGGNVSQHRISDTDTVNIIGGMFKIGYDFNKVFALEANLGATTTKSYTLVDDQGQEIGDYKVRARNAGVYARVNWRLVNVTLYGLLGVDYYQMIQDINVTGPLGFSDTAKLDKTGLSYGVGVDLFGGSQTALSLNWMQLINEDFYGDGEKTQVNAIYLGITYYFVPQKTNRPLSPRDRLNYF
jgi:hypothetical protein